MQVYRRKFNPGMAATLVSMWLELIRREKAGNPDRWIHVEHDLVETGKGPKRARDFSLMRFWGLIEPKARATRATGVMATDTGYWTVVYKGIQACQRPREALIDKYVLVYNNEPEAFEGPKISLTQAVQGSKFNLRELLLAGES